MTYTPPPEILERYASVLVNFALGGGGACSPARSCAWWRRRAPSPCMRALKAVWRAGGHVIGAYQPDDDAAREPLT